MGDARIEPRIVRISLRVKLTVGLILIIVLIFVGVSAFNLSSHQRARRAEALANSETIARLVVGAVIDEIGQGSPLNSERLRRVVDNFLEFGIKRNEKNKDLAYAVLVDANYKVLAGKAKTELVVFKGNKMIKDEKKCLAAIAKLGGKLGGKMKVRRFPLKISKSSPAIGMIIVGTSLARLESEARQELVLNFGVLAGALLVLILYLVLVLRALVVRPLTIIADAMRAVQKGDLEQVVEIDRSDEIGVLADTFNYMVGGLREQERLKDAFNKYVSEKVYAKFSDGSLTLTGEVREATILFSDIRSFTSLSEQLSATEVVEMLNEYFSRMVDVVLKYDGFVNKFIGDALMAIYNVPVDQDLPELRAVKTGVEMMGALEILNNERQLRGDFPIHIGIGINTGPVIAGNIGHVRRLEYTVIGDAVNLASRIESQTKVAGAMLLISESTYVKVAEFVKAEALPPVKLKGKSEPVPLYAIEGMKRKTELTGRLILKAPPVA